MPNWISLQLKQIKISKMIIEVIIRDGGTKSAYENKINTRTKMVEIERLDDNVVIDYFRDKRDALLAHLDKQILPPVCTISENWNWKRCKKFCEVYQYCPEGQKINARKM